MAKQRTHQSRSGQPALPPAAALILRVRSTWQPLQAWLESNAPEAQRLAFYRWIDSLSPSILSPAHRSRLHARGWLTAQPGDDELLAALNQTMPPEVMQPFADALQALNAVPAQEISQALSALRRRA